MFYTESGMVKKTEWKEYGVLKSAFQAIKLKEGDKVIGIETEKKSVRLCLSRKAA